MFPPVCTCKTPFRATFTSGLTVFVVAVLLLSSNASTLHAAAIFDPATQPISTIAPFELKDTDLSHGMTKAYRPWFENGTWQGDLIEYQVDSDGSYQTDVTIGANPPSATGSNWSARATFAAKETGNSNYWDTERKIITSITGVNQLPFRWSSLTDSQKLALDPSANVSDLENTVLNFTRGDRSQEGISLRTRLSIMGDIIDTPLAYVGAPTGGYGLAGYAEFVNANLSRTGRIYVSANDGMVHSFDATDGSEVFAYVPSMFFTKLKKLSKTPYQHAFFGNGGLVASDAKIGLSWKTILAGGFGPGQKGLFALDVTHPDLSSESANTGSDIKILFEKHAQTDDDIGYVYGNPSVVLLPDGKWYLASGNGYGSTNQMANLYLVDLNSPSNVTKVSPDPTTTSNGLSAPTFVDTDFDSAADIAYAGDLQGNLWKFQFSKVSGSLVVSSSKLFAAGANQPITVAPEVGIHPNGGYLVFFGTGSLLSGQDIGNTDQQSVYALWDSNTTIDNSCYDGSSGDLLCQTLDQATHTGGTKVILATALQPDWSVHKGWKVDLPNSGERLLGKPQLRSDRLQFVSTDINVSFVDNWLYQLNFITGGDSEFVLFDLNSDGVFDSSDKVDNSGGVPATPVGINLGVGNFSQPTLARINNLIDAIFINGILLPEPSTLCTGNCTGGIGAGQLNVNTDTPIDGLGGEIIASTAGYDDLFDVTFVDYFNLLDANQLAVTDAGIIPETQEFIVVVSNADLSPGATITIGQKSWNIVEYQKLIQQRLQAWPPGSVSGLVDDDGTPLTVTLDDISPPTGGEGLKITFNSDAIVRGGLIPTQQSCVEDAIAFQPNGRWRGGALTIQLLDFSSVKNSFTGGGGEPAFLFQEPTDLPTSVTLSSGTVFLIEDVNGDGIFESYGGVVANPLNDSGFLYESTLFWNYQGACYGDPDWETDRANSTFTDAEINEFLTSNAELINDIIAYECVVFSGGQCQDAGYSTLLADLQIALSGYEGNIAEFAGFISQGGLNSITNIGAPTTPDDKSQGLNSPQNGPGSGPNFGEGRQSWISISPEAL